MFCLLQNRLRIRPAVVIEACLSTGGMRLTTGIGGGGGISGPDRKLPRNNNVFCPSIIERYPVVARLQETVSAL
jgi:hypothetical protein